MPKRAHGNQYLIDRLRTPEADNARNTIRDKLNNIWLKKNRSDQYATAQHGNALPSGSRLSARMGRLNAPESITPPTLPSQYVAARRSHIPLCVRSHGRHNAIKRNTNLQSSSLTSEREGMTNLTWRMGNVSTYTRFYLHEQQNKNHIGTIGAT